MVLPLTVASLLDMTGVGCPYWLLVASTCIYALGGLVDALLFIFTRRSFIRNATAPAPQLRSRVQWPSASQQQHGITITQHELTFIDGPKYIHAANEDPLSPQPDRSVVHMKEGIYALVSPLSLTPPPSQAV